MAEWYVYDAGDGFSVFSTAEEAQSFAHETIGAYHEDALCGEWSEDVEFVEWGELVPHQRATVIAREGDTVQYGLAGVPESYARTVARRLVDELKRRLTGDHGSTDDLLSVGQIETILDQLAAELGGADGGTDGP